MKKPKSYFKKYNSYKEIQKLEKYCSYYNLTTIPKFLFVKYFHYPHLFPLLKLRADL